MSANGENGRGSAVQILELIQTRSARTRAELIAHTGLSRSTVSQRLSELFELNLVVGEGEASSTGGRPPALFAFNASAGVVIAAALGATTSRVAVVDLGGKVLVAHEEAHAIADGPLKTLQGIADQIDGLLQSCEITVDELWGIGVGLPGPVEFATGKPVSPPIMPGWDGFPVARWLEDKFSCLVRVDNDVNVMALGERQTTFPNENDLLFVKVGTGIGAGIILGGQLQRGAQGSAGDIGHITVPGHDEIVCECGNRGCLEALVGGRALASRLRNEGYPTSSSQDVVDQVVAGNTDAVLAVRGAGREVGLVLAGLVNALNPAIIVLGGAIATAGDHLLAGVREVVYARAPALSTRSVRIVTSTAGNSAGVVGAATMITAELLQRLAATGRRRDRPNLSRM